MSHEMVFTLCESIPEATYATTTYECMIPSSVHITTDLEHLWTKIRAAKSMDDSRLSNLTKALRSHVYPYALFV